MQVRIFREPLRASLASSETHAQFERARARRPALAHFSTVATIIGLLQRESEVGYPEFEPVCRAMIAEYQDNGGSLWSAILLLAFCPMLRGLRGRVRAAGISNDDIDQMIIQAFLSVLKTYPFMGTDSRTALHVRQLTTRIVVHELEAYHAEQEKLNELRREAAGDSSFDIFAGPVDLGNKDDFAETLLELARGHLSTKSIELVLATSINGERLEEYVARMRNLASQYGYDRSKRMRSRGLARLRHILTKPLGQGA